MNGFAAAMSVEFLKLRRSRVPWAVVVGLSLVPIVGGIFMLILKDPERARQLGLLGAKAQLTAGTADWPTFVDFVGQGTAVGDGILFAFLFAWLFGREWADRTIRDLVASPTRRSTFVLAKLAVGSIWSAAMALWAIALALVVGIAIDRLVGLPGGTQDGVARGFAGAAAAAVLTIVLQTFTALFASVGRGFIPGLAWAVLAVFLAQVFAVLGWGAWFPWSVPAVLAGAGGAGAEGVSLAGVVVLVATALAGLVATLRWWRVADQTT